ncbi:hypothetical protein D8674_004350 [Pyrus ussuriensis x Pyrus communis]|uniref:Uncharacterized protein n=1 Tax=Pyrus ussuriensis x Pyrus communis TaxID=2448454 RepID=A0A5N5FJL8_9ROSA|nr:hypothetical protein D8674_004350 [Pyrus ussuriensis x Pyrus communis]
MISREGEEGLESIYTEKRERSVPRFPSSCLPPLKGPWWIRMYDLGHDLEHLHQLDRRPNKGKKHVCNLKDRLQRSKKKRANGGPWETQPKARAAYARPCASKHDPTSC